MLMPASTEFADLCQSQITMMARAVGAESTAVYLAESWTEQALPQLVPIAVYPSATSTTQPRPGTLAPNKALPGTAFEPIGKRNQSHLRQAAALTPDEIEEVLHPERLLLPYGNTPHSEQTVTQQLAIPLTHENRVVGILVCRRADRPWQTTERDQMEACAHSLALACVLDQRGQWLQTQLSALNQLQAQQSDRFHELLHQLRNPLTALKTFGKLMVKRLSPEDKNQALALSMLRESDRMQDLLGYFDDTLEAADQTRAETGESSLLLPSADEDTTVEAKVLPVTADSLSHFGGALTIRPCNVQNLVAPLVGSLEALSEASNIALHILRPESKSIVNADAQALTEVISILLENALKYLPTGSDICMQWGLPHSQQSHQEGVLVADTGPGIPKADQPYIFERHYRGVQASGDIEGTGLGLAIACDLVQEMAGTIEVYSPLADLPESVKYSLEHYPAERGTAFIVWLPKG